MGTLLAFLRCFRMFDTVDSGGGGGTDDAGGGTPAPDAGGTPAEPGASPAPGSGGASPAPGDSGNIKQLRDAYEGLKREFEPFRELGDAATVQNQLQTLNAVRPFVEQIALQAGKELGFDEQTIRDSLNEDLVATLSYLRGRQVDAGKQGKAATPELQDALDKITALEKEIQPLKDRQAQSDRQTAISSAQAAFEQTFNQNLPELFKGITLSDAELDSLYGETFRVLQEDKASFKALMEGGKTSGILKAMDEAKNRLDKYYLARSEREKKRIPKPTPKPGEGGDDGQNSKYTLQDMAKGIPPPPGHPFHDKWKEQQAEG